MLAGRVSGIATSAPAGRACARPPAVRQRFTLVELLVVIAVIAMLAAILLPSLQGAKNTASFLVCRSNLRQVGVALLQYPQEYNDWFPQVSWGQSCFSVAADPVAAGYREDPCGGQDSQIFTRKLFPAYVENPDVFYCPRNIWIRRKGSVCPPLFAWPWSWPDSFWDVGATGWQKVNYEYYTNPWNRSQSWDNPWAGAMRARPPKQAVVERYGASVILLYEAVIGGNASANFSPIMAPHPLGRQASVRLTGPPDGHKVNVLCADGRAVGRLIRAGDNSYAVGSGYTLEELPAWYPPCN